MNPIGTGQRGRPPAWRKWALIVGAAAIYLLAFDRLQQLFPARSRPDVDGAETAPAPVGPVRPTITRIADGVEVAVGLHRTTVRLGGDEASVDALIACIEDGFDREGEGGGLPGPESPGLFSKMMNDKENAERVNRIIGACLDLDLPRPADPDESAATDLVDPLASGAP